MYLTPEQLAVIQEALEFAYEAKLREFEDNSCRLEIGPRQLATRAARAVKKYAEVLECIDPQTGMAS
jgi:hypothetical protein